MGRALPPHIWKIWMKRVQRKRRIWDVLDSIKCAAFATVVVLCLFIFLADIVWLVYEIVWEMKPG